MKILYAGNGVIGLLGLVEILSYSQFSIDDIYILDDYSDKSKSFKLIRDYSSIYGLKIIKDPVKIKLNFDLLISVHWRKLFNHKLISLAKKGAINLHPSLLPKYAGCSSLAWALANYEEKVGYSWHFIDSEFDTGDILLQEEIKIKDDDNAFSLWNRVNARGIKQIKVCIDMLITGDFKLSKQDLTKRSYYPRGFPSFSEIKKLIPHISYDQYQRASYFPNKPK